MKNKYYSKLFLVAAIFMLISVTAHAQTTLDYLNNIITINCRGSQDNHYCEPQNANGESFLAEIPLEVVTSPIFGINGCLDCGLNHSKVSIDSNPNSHPLSEIDGYRISPGINIVINFADGSCKVVEYGSNGVLFEAQLNYFIPTRTQREFQSFLDAVDTFRVPINVPRDCGCGDNVCSYGKERQEGDLTNPLLNECRVDCGVYIPVCNDGFLSVGGEECDLSDTDPFGGANCLNIINPDDPYFYSGGMLGCNASGSANECEYDRSTCTVCGDGECNGLETCGDSMLPNGGECEEDCSWTSCTDLSQPCDCGDGFCATDECCPEDCTQHCGNGIVEYHLGEQCDVGADLIGSTADDNLDSRTCESFGDLTGGNVLKCNDDCSIDLSACGSSNCTNNVEVYSNVGKDACPFGTQISILFMLGTWTECLPNNVWGNDYYYNDTIPGADDWKGSSDNYGSVYVDAGSMGAYTVRGPTAHSDQLGSASKEWILYTCIDPAQNCGNSVIDIGEQCELPNEVTCSYPGCQTMNYCQWSWDSCHTNFCNTSYCDVRYTDFNSNIKVSPSLQECTPLLVGKKHGTRVTGGDNETVYECVCGQPPVIEPIGNMCSNSGLISNGVCDAVECCGPECVPGLIQSTQDCCPYEPVLGDVCGDGDPSDPGEECDPPNGITCDVECQHMNFCAWSYEKCNTSGCATCTGGTVANNVTLPECTPELAGENWGMRIGDNNYNEYECRCGEPPVIVPTTWMCGGSQTCGDGICAVDECCGPECDVSGSQSICTQDCCAFAQ